MEQAKANNALSLQNAVIVIGFCLVGLAALGFFKPTPERAALTDGVFVYFGPEGETVFVADVVHSVKLEAERALSGADYFGAFAAGPYGRTGVWTGARSLELARRFAHADCGQGCQIIADRLPLHRDADRDEPIATAAMVRNLMMRWPFTDDYIALGGAGAWGHRPDPAGKGNWRSAMRNAAADCELRREAEAAPDGTVSPPCTVGKISDIDILLPKLQLYPADYTIGLTALTPVASSEVTQVTNKADESGIRSRIAYKPPRLHGARAANGASSFEVVRGAGWPEAGHAIALLKCNAERRPNEPPCSVTHTRTPVPEPPSQTLAVTTKLFEAFTDWERTNGHGAFAISPYGAWGWSYNHPNREAAIQKAADWCWYHTRRDWEYRQVNRASLSSGIPCRIVAIRSP